MQELRRLAALLLCVFGLAYPGRLSAQNAAPIELKWRALDGCPSAETVLARVRKIAGTTRPTANTLRADASVTQPSVGLFRLRLEIHYGDLAAVRNIEGKSCKDLAGAAAVALALLLSSEEPLSERDLAGTAAASTGVGTASTGVGTASTGVGTASTGQEPDTQAKPPNPPSSAPSAAPGASPSTEAEARRRWRVLLLAPVGSLGIGPMKQVSRGLGAGAGLSFDRWRILAEGRLWASQHETLSNLGDVYDVELNRFTVGARGCYVVFGERFELAPCALMSVHHLSVRGSGPNLAHGTDSATWAAVGVGARARVLITAWLGLVAAVDGEIELARPEVSVSLPIASPGPTAVPVVHLAPFAATLSVGAEWIF
jgi:hypothetical protein